MSMYTVRIQVGLLCVFIIEPVLIFQFAVEPWMFSGCGRHRGVGNPFSSAKGEVLIICRDVFSWGISGLVRGGSNRGPANPPPFR